MGNACCNDRGPEDEAYSAKNLKLRAHNEDVQPENHPEVVIKPPLNAQPRNGNGASPVQRAEQEPDISQKEADRFNYEPHQFLGLDQNILKLIEKHTLYTLPAQDTKIPYNKYEGTAPDGRKYRYFGQFQDGRKVGRGQLQFLEKDGRNGEFVICNFIDDVAEGNGAIYFPNGDFFKGRLSKNQMKEGTFYTHDDNRYEGPFLNNLFDGQGSIYYKDKRKYKGQFRAGRKNGRGRFDWPDGSFYEGEWKNGIQEGHGKYVDAANVIHEGEFKDGKKIKGTH